MSFAPLGAPLESRLLAGRTEFLSCWRWLGAHNPKGYGQITVDGRKHQVHRIAYEVWIGPIPSGMEINHLCWVRDCFNPKHLEVVTHAENIQKRSGEPYLMERRRPFPKTHCHHGHELTATNTILYRGKYRACRECHNLDVRVRRQRSKELQHNG